LIYKQAGRWPRRDGEPLACHGKKKPAAYRVWKTRKTLGYLGSLMTLMEGILRDHKKNTFSEYSAALAFLRVCSGSVMLPEKDGYIIRKKALRGSVPPHVEKWL